MRAEIRADGLHLMGYANVPGRMSRPVATPRGKVIEVIEPGVFRRAIAKAKEIRLLRDHGKQIATTENRTFTVREDNVGLRAEAVITDAQTIADARAGKIRGWSFNMRNVIDEIEERTEGLPIRHVKEIDMDELTLAIDKIPVYSSTSVELRAEEEADVEMRAIEDPAEGATPKEQNKNYLERLKKIKEVKFG